MQRQKNKLEFVEETVVKQKFGVNELRRMYLEFFESKDHLAMKSFSLVPHNDNSLLLINAGMAPLKPYFTGQEIPPRRRVTTCQKCIRTGDIENVGKTARHLTFFEMLLHLHRKSMDTDGLLLNLRLLSKIPMTMQLLHV